MDKRHLHPSETGSGSQYSPYTSFMRHSRAVGVLWGVFTLCFTIIVVVVFIQPHWIGAGRDTSPGHMGLWRWCTTTTTLETVASDVTCTGQLQDITTFINSEAASIASGATGIINTPFKIASILTGLSVAMTAFSVIAMLLFICVKPNKVFHIAGFLQLLAGSLLGGAVCVYPLGFSSSEVRHMCGPTARQYNVGECSIRWAYVLAIIGVFDAIVLSALAFVLATRQIKKRIGYGNPDVYKGDFGNSVIMADGASLAASRKSLNLQPVMMMPSDPYHL